jgi:hypothetical protein
MKKWLSCALFVAFVLRVSALNKNSFCPNAIHAWSWPSTSASYDAILWNSQIVVPNTAFAYSSSPVPALNLQTGEYAEVIGGIELGGGPVSFATWILPGASIATAARFFTFGQGVQTGLEIPYYAYLEFAAPAGLEFGYGSVNAAGTGAFNSVLCAGALPTGAYHHIAVTVSSTGIIQVYVDGSLKTCVLTNQLGAVGIQYGNYSASYFGKTTATAASPEISMQMSTSQIYYDVLTPTAVATLFADATAVLAGGCAAAPSFTTAFSLNFLGKDFTASAPDYFDGAFQDFQIYNLDMDKGTDTCGPAPPPAPPPPPMPPPSPPPPPQPPMPPAAPSTSSTATMTLRIHGAAFASMTYARRAAVALAVQTLLGAAPEQVSTISVADGGLDLNNDQTILVGVGITLSPALTAAAVQTSVSTDFPSTGPCPSAVLTAFNAANAAAFGASVKDVTRVPTTPVLAVGATEPTGAVPGVAITLEVVGFASDFAASAQRSFAAAVQAFLASSGAAAAAVFVTGTGPGSSAQATQVGLLLSGVGGAAAAATLLNDMPSPGPFTLSGQENTALIAAVQSYGLPELTSVTAVSVAPTPAVVDAVSTLATTSYSGDIIVNAVLDSLGVALVQAALAKELSASVTVLGFGPFNATATSIGVSFATLAAADGLESVRPAILTVIQQTGLPQITVVETSPTAPSTGFSTFQPATAYVPTDAVVAFTVSVSGIAAPPTSAQVAAVVAGLGRSFGLTDTTALYVTGLADGSSATNFLIGVAYAAAASAPAITALPASALADVQGAGLPQTTAVSLTGVVYDGAALSMVYAAPGATVTVALQNITLAQFGAAQQRAFAAAVAAVIGVAPTSGVQLTYVGATATGAVQVGFGAAGANIGASLAAVVPSGTGTRAALLTAVKNAGLPMVSAILTASAVVAPLQSVSAALPASWGNNTVSAVFHVSGVGIALASLTAAEKTAFTSCVCQALGVAESSAYVLSYGSITGGIAIGFSFGAVGLTVANVLAFPSAHATALATAGGFPQVSAITLFGAPLASVAQGTANSLANTILTLSMPSGVAPLTDIPVQRAVIAAMANATGIADCCAIVEANALQMTMVVFGASSTVVNRAIKTSINVGPTVVGGTFTPALVAAGFVQVTADADIVSIIDGIAEGSYIYGAIHTITVEGLTQAQFTPLAQYVFLASVCASAGLEPGCATISGTNFTATATGVGEIQMGLLFGTNTEAELPALIAAVSKMITTFSLVADLNVRGFSTISAITLIGAASPFLPVIEEAESIVVSTSLGLNNMNKGFLSTAQESAVIAAVGEFVGVSDQFISVNGITATARRRLMGVVGSGVAPDVYIGVSINVFTAAEAQVVNNLLVRNDTLLMQTIQQNGLPQVTSIFVGLPIISQSKNWVQTAAPYAYATFQIVGLNTSDISNATQTIFESAVAATLNLNPACVFSDNFNAAQALLGVVVSEPCVNTAADRISMISLLHALAPSYVGGAKPALATALAVGGLPQVTAVLNSIYEPPPPSPPPSPPVSFSHSLRGGLRPPDPPYRRWGYGGRSPPHAKA